MGIWTHGAEKPGLLLPMPEGAWPQSPDAGTTGVDVSSQRRPGPISAPESWFCSPAGGAEARGESWRARSVRGQSVRTTWTSAGCSWFWMTDGRVLPQETAFSAGRFQSNGALPGTTMLPSPGAARFQRSRRSGLAGSSDKHLPQGCEGKTGNQRTTCSDENPE